MNKKSKGFTLIELMVTVAIVGILAAIAYPSYTEHIARSRRADAKSVLLEGAQFMERLYTERGAYNRDDKGADKTKLKDIGFPDALTNAPKDGTSTYYTIDAAADLASDSFVLKATPTGVQAHDKCGALTLSNTGEKGISNNDESMTIASCWNR